MIDHQKVLKLRPQLRAYASALCGNAADADDLVQEALARALSHHKAPIELDELRRWLFRIIRNLFIDNQRRQRVREEYSASHKRLFDEQPIEDNDQLDFLVLRQALESVSDDHREVLFLVDIMGMSYSEAAAVMDVANGTVMSRLSRARRAVMDRIEQSNVTPISMRRAWKR